MAFRLAILCCITVWLILGGSSAHAQDFTVVTETYDLNAQKVIGRSRSIFHAGEVYDHVMGLGEITKFQPALEQFTIFSESPKLATTITFKEIMEKQREFDKQIQSYIAVLRKRGGVETLRKAGELEFQLQPVFQKQSDEKRHMLTMASEYYTYTVETESDVKPQVVDVYLRYADWTKRFNGLLDDRAIFPAPRLVVNQELRDRKVMPVSVTLKQHTPSGIHYQARHLIRWKLTDPDRAAVLSWSKLLNSEEIKWVSFNEFQAAVRPNGGN